MSQELNFLYDFLPAVYKQQDQQQGLPLQALFSIMQEELQNIQQQIDAAYANCFIETCESWVEPYIASLLGIKELDSDTLFSQRARIANAIRYCRRKGQEGMLERVIYDVTGWYTDIKEYAQLIGMTQHIQHLRPNKGQTINIRNKAGLKTLRTYYEENAHLIDVRSFPRYPAKFNINTIGLYTWRLVSYPITSGTAFKVPVATAPAGYTFSPIGLDTQLFNAPRSPTGLTQAIEATLPTPISQSAFAQDLKDNSASSAEYPFGKCVYYGDAADYQNAAAINQILITLVDNNDHETIIKAEKIVAADLCTWTPESLAADHVVIDVKLGRFILGSCYTGIKHVEVNYNYGFSAPIGGGHYDRQQTLGPVDENTIYVPYAPYDINNAISKLTLDGDNGAIALWKSDPKYTTIQIMNDATYTINSNLLITIDESSPSRTCIIQAAINTRPCLQLSTNSTIQTGSTNSALAVTLNGLLIDGSIDLQKNVNLTISHCTLAPKNNVVSIRSSTAADGSVVTIDHSITGALRLSENILNLSVSDSIIDAQNSVALLSVEADASVTPNVPAKPGPITKLERTTVFGSMYVSELLLLSDSIVTGKVTTDRTQTGTVRFSYLPIDSETPPRYQCQPTSGNNSASSQPSFTSTSYNNPGYAQLDIINSPQKSITMGASNGSEMGCFQLLNQSQREMQLQAVLDEYMPLGLAASIFYMT